MTTITTPPGKKPISQSAARKIEDMRAKGRRACEAALSIPNGNDEAVQVAAKFLFDSADRLEQREFAAANPPESLPAILVIPDNATPNELADARRRQSVKRGNDVFLPSWGGTTIALPYAFVRSALFSARRSIQTGNKLLLTESTPTPIENKEVATFNDLTLRLSGLDLCQFDRQVYVTCLDYYREVPLASETGDERIQTKFSEFAKRMGSKYSTRLHASLCASLTRLSLAGISMRFKGEDFAVSKLIFFDFEKDEDLAGKVKGSDVLSLCVTVAVAELFGPKLWTAVDKTVIGYDGLKGWVANFYASHSGPRWLPLTTLYRMSGYGSTINDFKKRLPQALEQLTDMATPNSCRVSSYGVTSDKTSILVMRAAWAGQKPPVVPKD